MKKIFLSLLMLAFSSSLFAGMIVQADDIIGPLWINDSRLEWDYKMDIFDSRCDTYFGFSWIDTSLSLFYEFDTEEDKPVHWFTGGTIGLSLLGADASLGGGLNAKITDFNNTNLEFCYTGEAGYLIDIFGGSHLILKNNFDFLFMPESRKGWYGGLGLGTASVIDCNIYLNSGVDAFFYTAWGLHLTAGYRF